MAKTKEIVSSTGPDGSVETSNGKSEDLQNIFDSFMLTNNKDLVVSEDNKLVIPTGIDLLDGILGGGIGMKFSMLIGPPGAGKSALVSRIIATGQKMWPDKFVAMYLDSEEAMTSERLNQLGVKGHLNPINDVSVEKVFKLVESMCTFKEKNKEARKVPSLIVWDSIANTHTESMIEADLMTNTMGAQRAKAIAFYLPKYITKMNEYNIALLGINQVRDEIVMDQYNPVPKAMNFMKSGVVPGGKSLIHNSIQAIELYQAGAKDYTEKTYGFKGIKVIANAVRNKLFTPNVPVELIFNFANGYSNFWTNIEMLKKSDYIDGGAWSYLKSCPQPKFQGIKNALEICENNPEWKDSYLNDVKDCIKVKYIDMYKNQKSKTELENN